MSDVVNVQPEGLGAAGAGLWSRFVPAFEFSEREAEILALACATADTLAQLEAALATGGITVEGSKGQPRVNPLLAEIRAQRIAQARLLSALRLPDEDGVPRTAGSERAQHAARSRWTRTEDVRRSRRSSGGDIRGVI